MASCSDVYMVDPAINQVVTNSITSFRSLADQWGNEASSNIRTLGEFLSGLPSDSPAVDTTITVDLGTIQLGDYQAPPPIVLDEGLLGYTEPPAARLREPGTISAFVTPASKPSWIDPGVSFDFSGEPGPAPTLDYGARPNLTVPAIRAPDAVRTPSQIARVSPRAINWELGASAPQWTRPDPVLDTSGAPGPAPSAETAAVPGVTVPSIAQPGTLGLPSLPATVQVPALDLSGFGPAPAWTQPALSLDLSGQPGAVPGVALGEVPAMTLPAIGAPDAITTPAALQQVALTPIDTAGFPSPPVWTGEAPAFDISGAPGARPTLDWGQLPTITRPAFPDAPSLTHPTKPALLELLVPDFAALQLPSLEVPVADPGLPGLSNQFSYSEQPYSSAQMTVLQTEISRVINGDLGVPGFVWDAVWARAAGQLQRQGQARRREARRAWAKLGWEMPGGVALAQSEQAEQEINEQISAQVLEKTLQHALQKREDFWQAMQQGVALEQLALQAWTGYQERQLRAAQAYQEAAVATYNALVAGYNAVIQQAQVKVEVKRLELQGALAKLDEHRLTLERARVAGEIDKNRLQAYLAEWEGVKAEVAVYAEQLRGVEADLSVQRAGIEAYGARVQANTAILDAWGKEWDGYSAKINAENLKLGKYQTEASIFGERVRAFQAHSGAEASKVDARVRVEGLKVEVGRLETERYRAELAPEELKLQRFSADADAKLRGAEAQRVLLDAHRLKAEAKDLELRAWQAEWAGYGQKIAGEQLRVAAREGEARVFSAQVDAFQAQTQGATAKVQARTDHSRTQVEAARLGADVFRAQIEGGRAQTERYEAGVRAVVASSEAQQLLLRAHELKLRAKEIETTLWAQQWQGYGTKIQAEQTKLSAEEILARVFDSETRAFEAAVAAARAKAETQAEAAKLDVEVGRLDTERYRADWEGEKVKADTYASEMRGIETGVNAQQAAVQAWATQVEAEKTRIDAWAKEWDGYSAKMGAQTSKAQVLNSYAQVFAERMRGYGLEISAEQSRVAAEAQVAQQLIDLSRLDIDRYRAEWDGIRAKLGAVGQLYQTKGQVYQSQVSGELARIEGMNKSADIAIRKAEIEGNLQARSAELAISQLQRYAVLQAEGLQAMSNIYAQLTSSVYAAANISASVGSSLGESYSYSTNRSLEC
jgi:hypothetical protein